MPDIALVLGGGEAAATPRFARMAALALSLSVVYAAAYIVASRGFRAHLEPGKFNFYLNLPTTTLAADRIPRRQTKLLAVLCLIVGLTLPFVVPAYLRQAAMLIEIEPLAFRPTVVWGIALWAWVPAIAVLRGVALYRVAESA